MIATREAAWLTADVVLLAEQDGQRQVLLVQRDHDPFAGCWALPGGHVDPGEEVEAAAHRELAEETGLHAMRLDLVGVYSTPGRDPRGRYVTFVFAAALSGLAPAPTAGDDAAAARWWPVSELPVTAFDHHRIITDTLAGVAR